MNDQANKTSICSIVALDLIDYSKKTGAEKLEIKQLFNAFIQNAVLDIPDSDRNIIDTADGAAIACKGALEDALEDALFISITIRDEILKHNQHNATPLYVQFGIHLGAARALNNHIVGEGIDEAQRIMRFANPNQILVSNAYFEMASKLTQEIAQMFEKYEMHAYEHDVYAVRLLKESMVEEPATAANGAAVEPTIASSLNWTYISLGLLTLAAFLMLAKLVMNPVEPTITLVQPAQIQPMPVLKTIDAEAPVADIIKEESAAPVIEKTIADTKPVADVGPVANKTVKEKIKQTKVTQKPDMEKAATNSTKSKPEKIAEDKAPTSANTKEPEAKVEKETTKQAVKETAKAPVKETAKEKSGWQTFKDSVTTGAERKCTQAEIALNQCAK